MSDTITITVQDAGAGIRVRCEAWEGKVHLTFLEYGSMSENECAEPSFTPEGARSLAAVLAHLAEGAA